MKSRKKILASSLVFLSLVATSAQNTELFQPTKDKYKLIWQDEFNGNELDLTKWDYRQIGKRNDAVNCKESVSVKNGNLIITSFTILAPDKNKTHYTGMISTDNNFMSTCGYYEARIKFSSRKGMWSAFWIQSPTVSKMPYNPEENGVEIDIMEHRCFDKDENLIINMASSALHWDGYGVDHKSKGAKKNMPGLSEGYHIYGMEWTKKGYYFYFDGELISSLESPDVPVSKALQSIVLSSEIKDNFWAGKIPENGYGTLEESKTNMMVDYVRVYKRK